MRRGKWMLESGTKKITVILISVLIVLLFVLGVNDVRADIGKDINKAIPLFLRKDYKKARKIFLNILKKDRNNIVARYYLAEIMFTDVRRYNDAKKQFEIVLRLRKKNKSKKFKIRNMYIFNNSMLKIGLVHLKNGQNLKAIEYLSAFLKSDQESPPAKAKALNSIAVAYSNLDDYENAIYYFEEAINFDKDNLLAKFNLSALNSKLIYYNTGIDLSVNGKHIEAAREFVKSLDVDPFFVAAHFRLGMEHKHLRNYTDALNELRRAYAINPDYVYNYRILSELGDILYNLRDLSGAREYIDKSLKLNDSYARTYNTLGKINMQEGDYEEAVSSFQKAIQQKEIAEFKENLKKAEAALNNNDNK
jgi:tetratricopeptide (TPR) repeat protein